MNRLVRAVALAFFAVLLVPGVAKAIDLQTDLGGFSGGQATGLRDTYGIETVQVHITDISTAATDYVVSHFAGSVTDWYCVLGAVITTADSTLLLTVNGVIPSAGSSLTVLGIGSAIGDIDSSSAVAGATIAAGQSIAVNTSGASTTTAEEVCTIVIDR